MSNDVTMISVSSSNIESIGYNDQSQEVHVRFLDGSEYIYKGVPQHEFDTLLNAPSKGSYLHRNYKNVFSYEKID